MYAMRNKFNQAMMRAFIRAQAMKLTAQQKLREKDGNFFTEHGLAIVIVVVIAAIVILAVTTLFKDKIFPQLNDKVDDFFAIS